MANFLLGVSETNTFVVSRRCIQWVIDFSLPDEVRENMPSGELIKIDGIFVMDFYADPMVGDRITHLGHCWQITGRIFAITKHKKREPKSVPSLEVQYVGKA